MIGRMSENVFTPGTSVITPRGRGVVVDVRATPSGAWVIGVEDATGEVGYFTEKALWLEPRWRGAISGGLRRPGIRPLAFGCPWVPRR